MLNAQMGKERVIGDLAYLAYEDLRVSWAGRGRPARIWGSAPR